MNMKPKWAYYGHHRCASNWIHKIIESICDGLRIPRALQDHAMAFPDDGAPGNGANRGDFLITWNSDYVYVRDLDCRGFHVIRDPRDIIVSSYFSHLESHPDDEWPRLRHFRKYLRTLDKEDGLQEELKFSSIYLYQIYSWDYGNPLILEKKFEDLVISPVAEFATIFRHLRMIPRMFSEADLARVVEEASFRKLSGGRTPGQEDASHHYRKGEAGDWKNHFSPRHIDLFKKLYDPILRKTGYEKTSDW